MKSEEAYLKYSEWPDTTNGISEPELAAHLLAMEVKNLRSILNQRCHGCGSLSGVYYQVCDDCMTEMKRESIEKRRAGEGAREETQRGEAT